ncbi:hypothetical protein HYH02_013395 [Chlamydomonas schloesseri]|uniref:ELMO domain-containing protein n=1 Tax=Chlamydomonas schloesseri TaxID=2026947 RepID=A0A835W027_9CHLO|nr:hypothetical protein HYH02_013395 [Chlamydomonas schloesseri]|eukprot:KAG2431261.1 hypothetical protein HYH02_013395 [Chlamydomonas schloesseri]
MQSVSRRATDFRGAGLYGLDNLIYLAEVHPHTFRRLMDKSEGTRATWEYPFMVAGLNLTWALSELLELHAVRGWGGGLGRPADMAQLRQHLLAAVPGAATVGWD